MRVVIVSLLVAATAAAVSAASVPCTFAVTSPIKATYDLTALQASDPAGWLSIDETNDGSGIDFYYRYNICNDLAAPPTTTPTGLCGTLAGNFYQIYNNTATHVDTRCHLISAAAGMNWSFVEDTNPMMGLQQHYGGGDACVGTADGERDILVTFECLTTGAEPKLGRVNEENSCDYELYIRSIHACPLECPRPNEQLCSGHGVCGADDDLKAMRCFCNTGYGGADCSEESSGTSSGSSHANQVLVAFVIILTIALLAMAVVLYRKIKKLNADDSNYGQLQGGEGDAAPRRAAAPVVPAATAHSDDHAASSHLADAVAVNA